MDVISLIYGFFKIICLVYILLGWDEVGKFRKKGQKSWKWDYLGKENKWKIYSKFDLYDKINLVVY